MRRDWRGPQARSVIARGKALTAAVAEISRNDYAFVTQAQSRAARLAANASRLTTPVFLLTGEMDSPAAVRSNYEAARVPAAFGNLKMSNQITMMNGKGHMRMAPEVAAWFRYQLLKDEVAKKWFVGADCVLCKDPEWVYAQKMLR